MAEQVSDLQEADQAPHLPGFMSFRGGQLPEGLDPPWPRPGPHTDH